MRNHVKDGTEIKKKPPILYDLSVGWELSGGSPRNREDYIKFIAEVINRYSDDSLYQDEKTLSVH